MNREAAVFIADGHGLVGNAIKNRLHAQGFKKVITGDSSVLNVAARVEALFAQSAPLYVFLIGDKSGGIRANQNFPVDLMRDNLLAVCHVMESARQRRVEKLLYLASSCAYPKFCEQPMRVEALMTGKLEPTNEAYATAKLAGLALCQAYRQQFEMDFISAIPANIFGPGDDFSAEDSHVVGALIRRMHEAKLHSVPEVVIWGTGSPRREFIFADDLADACIFLMGSWDEREAINIGVGRDWSIRELAEIIREVVGYQGKLTFDSTRPDGMPAKLLDSSRLRELGWQPSTPIKDGLRATYAGYLKNLDSGVGGGDARAVV